VRPVFAMFVFHSQLAMVVPTVPPFGTTIINMMCLQYHRYHRYHRSHPPAGLSVFGNEKTSLSK
jgi:hypothetical protein